jgi:L-amino acid N-acyltransferase YncA
MMLVRDAIPDDAQAVAQIHVEAWRTAYAAILPEAFLASLSVASRQAFWVQFLAEKQGNLQVAMDDGRMLGWINTGPCRDQSALNLNPAVTPQPRAGFAATKVAGGW